MLTLPPSRQLRQVSSTPTRRSQRLLAADRGLGSRLRPWFPRRQPMWFSSQAASCQRASARVRPSRDRSAEWVAALDAVDRALGVIEDRLSADDGLDGEGRPRVKAVAALSALLEDDFTQVRESEAFRQEDFAAVAQMLVERRDVLLARASAS